MAGEQLRHTALGAQGIPGDRVVHAVDVRGRVATSRSRPKRCAPGPGARCSTSIAGSAARSRSRPR
ncbi:MAG: hypothetical protein H0T46_35095 [Deltaproteobacteria bacterium]|nr:hypothetical protein [Deltaproteobacteria bacterium]